jgi:hypothetical protein
MRAVILIGAVAGAIVLVTGFYMFRKEIPLRRNDLPCGFKSPVVAMQMARSMQEVERIVGESGHSRMRRLQYADFLFIGAYWLLFVVMGISLWQKGFLLAQLLGALVAIFATTAALSDLVENTAALRVLRAPTTPSNDHLVRAVSNAAAWKWHMFSTTMLLLGFSLMLSADDRTVADTIIVLAGLLSLATGVLGLIGIQRRDATLEKTVWTIVPGLLLLICALICFPSEFLRGL